MSESTFLEIARRKTLRREAIGSIGSKKDLPNY